MKIEKSSEICVGKFDSNLCAASGAQLTAAAVPSWAPLSHCLVAFAARCLGSRQCLRLGLVLHCMLLMLAGLLLSIQFFLSHGHRCIFAAPVQCPSIEILAHEKIPMPYQMVR